MIRPHDRDFCSYAHTHMYGRRRGFWSQENTNNNLNQRARSQRELVAKLHFPVDEGGHTLHARELAGENERKHVSDQRREKLSLFSSSWFFFCPNLFVCSCSFVARTAAAVLTCEYSVCVLHTVRRQSVGTESVARREMRCLRRCPLSSPLL